MARSFRVKRVAVQPETLITMGKGQHTQALEVVAHRLPADASYVHATFDANAGAVYLFLESATFPLVAEGEVVPILPATEFRIVTPPTPRARKPKPAATVTSEPH